MIRFTVNKVKATFGKELDYHWQMPEEFFIALCEHGNALYGEASREKSWDTIRSMVKDLGWRLVPPGVDGIVVDRNRTLRIGRFLIVLPNK